LSVRNLEPILHYTAPDVLPSTRTHKVVRPRWDGGGTYTLPNRHHTIAATLFNIYMKYIHVNRGAAALRHDCPW